MEIISRKWADRKSTLLPWGWVRGHGMFAASTYIVDHWVAVPTTLLSIVEASRGGKGFDLPEGKNLSCF